MRLNDYQELSKRTMPVKSKDAKANYAMGLAGESGEVVDLIKKEIYHGHPINREEVKKELGDTMHYLSGLASYYDLTLEEICTTNLDKLKSRYPSGFSQERSINRVE